MFNIKSLAVKETATIDLNDLHDEPLINEKGERCSVTIHGPGSRAFVRAQDKRSQAIVARLQKKGAKGSNAEDAAEFLASITVSFNGFVYGEGLEGHEMFKAAYSDPAIGWVVEQISAKAGDWGNFSKPSATN